MRKTVNCLLSLLCVVALLPIPSFASSSIEQVEVSPQQVSQWTKSQFHETTTITDTVFLLEEIIMVDGAEFIVDGDQLVIAPDAVFMVTLSFGAKVCPWSWKARSTVTCGSKPQWGMYSSTAL